MRFYIKTFGCRLNQHEGDIISEKFLDVGFVHAGLCEADIIIVNGCTVTARSDQKVRQFIHKVQRENAAAKIFLTGCTANAIKDSLIEPIGGVTVIARKNRYRIHDIIDESESGESPGDFPAISGIGISRTRAWLKIQDGCNRKCAYCIVPLVRGDSRSRSPDDIVNQVKAFVSSGFKEIVLTGVDIGDWRNDNRALPYLLHEILAKTKIYRVRLSSLEPPGLTDELLDIIDAEPRIAKHLHIPIQSSSPKVLMEMGRPVYIPDEIVAKLEALRKRQPEICFGTDIIVGFPTETEQDFEMTANMLKTKTFAYSHIFRFSARPGTTTCKIQEISSNIVARRASFLRELDTQNRKIFAAKFIGERIDFLIERCRENYSTGHAGNYLSVRAFGKAKRGDTACIMVKSAGEMIVEGEIII